VKFSARTTAATVTPAVTAMMRSQRAVVTAILLDVHFPSSRGIVQRGRNQRLSASARTLAELPNRIEGRAPMFLPGTRRDPKLLPRERIARLLDAGAPWLELSSVAGYCLDNPDPVAASRALCSLY